MEFCIIRVKVSALISLTLLFNIFIICFFKKMKSLSLTIFLACLFSISVGEKVRFDNYRVHSIKIENESQLRFLQDLENFRDGIEFIHSPVVTLQTVDIIVPPHKFADIAELFESNQIQHEVKIENLQK